MRVNNLSAIGSHLCSPDPGTEQVLSASGTKVVNSLMQRSVIVLALFKILFSLNFHH